MLYIVFDLEWNPIFRNRKLIGREITEIGAVEVQEVDGMLMTGRSFHAYVRPRHRIKQRIKELTHLTAPDTWLAPRFTNMVHRFEQWLGKQQAVFCSWGEADREVLLQQLFHNRLKPTMFTEYFDLQAACTQAFSLPRHQPIGLKRAVEELGLDFSGQWHSAIDDARNTAEVFQKMFRQIDMVPQPFVKDLRFNEAYRNRVADLWYFRRRSKIHCTELAEVTKWTWKQIVEIEKMRLFVTMEEIQELRQKVNELAVGKGISGIEHSEQTFA